MSARTRKILPRQYPSSLVSRFATGYFPASRSCKADCASGNWNE